MSVARRISCWKIWFIREKTLLFRLYKKKMIKKKCRSFGTSSFISQIIGKNLRAIGQAILEIFSSSTLKTLFRETADALTPLLSSSEDFGLKNCSIFVGLLNWRLKSPLLICLKNVWGILKKNQAARQQTATYRITNSSRPLRMKWYISINNAQIFMKFQENAFEMFYF